MKYIIVVLERRGFFIWPLRLMPSILVGVFVARVVYLDNGPVDAQWIYALCMGCVFTMAHGFTHVFAVEEFAPWLSYYWGTIQDEATLLEYEDRKRRKQLEQKGELSTYYPGDGE